MSVQFLIVMVPVVLGMMGFAVDLGRMYLVRGELNQAASAMAMAAAAQLNGTLTATGTATSAAQLTLDNAQGDGNKFNFGSAAVGQSGAFLESVAQDPADFDSVASALSAVGQSGAASGADGTTARHVTVNLTADAPLLFWSLLSAGQSRKTSIAAAAVAGVSAPLCTACGIDPYAIAAVNATDAVNFGFVAGNLYTLGFNCNGTPGLLPGTTGPALKYLIVDRYNTGSVFDESQQLFRTGSQGLLPSAAPGLACLTIGSMENVWATTIAPVQACAAGAPNASVRNAMCGLSARMTDPTQFAACAPVTDIATLASAYAQDTDITNQTDYTLYAGDNRRLLTLPIVDALSSAGGMTVLGFRQFLLQPTTNFATAASNNPADGDSRFAVLYAGVVAPVKQGSIGPACGVTRGPGKVVLHQ
jgi:Flp pilus assembly protein TadG